MKLTFFFVACAAAGLAQAQTGAIPARTRPDNSAELTQETVKNTALELPGAIMKGAAVLQHQMGGEGAVQMLDAAGKGAAIISYTADGTRLVGAAVNGGTEGLKTEGAQLLFERGADAVGEVGKAIAVRSAISGGLGAVTASGAAGIAYTGGSLIGGWARDSEWLGEKLGLERTLGHEVDNFYWKWTPDVVKEYASGTKQVDIDSPEFQRDTEMEIARRKRQFAFERVQRENAEQQRQAAQFTGTVPGDGGPASEPSSSGDASLSTAQFLDQLNRSLQTLQTTRPAAATPAAPAAPTAQPAPPTRAAPTLQVTQTPNRLSSPLPEPTAAKQCTIDPATGCHPGHNEKAHPGGCKCGR